MDYGGTQAQMILNVSSGHAITMTMILPASSIKVDAIEIIEGLVGVIITILLLYRTF